MATKHLFPLQISLISDDYFISTIMKIYMYKLYKIEGLLNKLAVHQNNVARWSWRSWWALCIPQLACKDFSPLTGLYPQGLPLKLSPVNFEKSVNIENSLKSVSFSFMHIMLAILRIFQNMTRFCASITK